MLLGSSSSSYVLVHGGRVGGYGRIPGRRIFGVVLGPVSVVLDLEFFPCSPLLPCYHGSGLNLGSAWWGGPDRGHVWVELGGWTQPEVSAIIRCVVLSLCVLPQQIEVARLLNRQSVTKQSINAGAGAADVQIKETREGKRLPCHCHPLSTLFAPPSTHHSNSNEARTDSLFESKSQSSPAFIEANHVSVCRLICPEVY